MTAVSTDTTSSSNFDAVRPWVRNAIVKTKRVTGTLEFRVLFVVLLFVGLWGTGIAVFGYPALIIPALFLVPVIFTCLMLITVGR